MKTIRCAIYTRKSTEEGLEQEFNTLDAQREAGEAYIASQKSQGWVCLPDRYDDGGFTGGNMERPALRHLVADIERGLVDYIVVYKADRLSRSLIDFAKIMDVLDRKEVAFVSVTQQFNTGNSMGRLMLNVLLSFAQFEREMISERIRDKVAATRRKGKWTGGVPVLGYDVAEDGGRLMVNEDEAARVREIFSLYLELQSIMETIETLDRRGWVTKHWVSTKGNLRGAKPFTKQVLHRLLTNHLYAGDLLFEGQIYPGEQDAIVDRKTFDQVQRLLSRNNRNGGKHVRNRFHGATDSQYDKVTHRDKWHGCSTFGHKKSYSQASATRMVCRVQDLDPECSVLLGSRSSLRFRRPCAHVLKSLICQDGKPGTGLPCCHSASGCATWRGRIPLLRGFS